MKIERQNKRNIPLKLDRTNKLFRRWHKRPNFSRLYFAYQLISEELSNPLTDFESIEPSSNSITNEFMLSQKMATENAYLEHVEDSKIPFKWYNEIETKRASRFNSANILLIIIIKNNYSFYYIL